MRHLVTNKKGKQLAAISAFPILQKDRQPGLAIRRVRKKEEAGHARKAAALVNPSATATGNHQHECATMQPARQYRLSSKEAYMHQIGRRGSTWAVQPHLVIQEPFFVKQH
jgi:hypothetical protein